MEIYIAFGIFGGVFLLIGVIAAYYVYRDNNKVTQIVETNYKDFERETLIIKVNVYVEGVIVKSFSEIVRYNDIEFNRKVADLKEIGILYLKVLKDNNYEE